jgi:hypothetical protein
MEGSSTCEVIMAVNGVASNNVPAAPPAPPARQQQARPVIDKPAEAAPPAPAKPAPTVNTSGQTIGTTINTSA